ncbi:MAG: HAMP domain-containing sensor histidine kinase [Clostridia bacterium]|nr:HAMP domain-containing sensor histidine kinase [Clostridia bacterium]
MKKSHPNRDTLMARYGLSFLILVLIFAVITVLQFFFMENMFIRVVRNNMKEAAQSIEQLEFGEKDYMTKLSDIEAKYDIYIEIYHPRDTLIYSSNNNDTVFGSQGSSGEMKPRIMRILEHEDLDEKSYFETRQEYFATAKYIVYGTFFRDNAGIEMYYSLDVIEANAKTASFAILWVSLALLLIIFFIFLAYTYTFVVPLKKINRITKNIGNLDFSEVCPQFGVRELGELSRSVNALSASLDMTMQDLKKKNERLEHEVERERRLEEGRKQFIANASHELKTPIAIIQGYAEGITFAETKEQAEEYSGVIIEESKKMNRLVVRLLELMRFENGGHIVQNERIPLRETVLSLVSSRKKYLSENGITLDLNINENFVGYGDADLFERVFNNYFSNALSHIDGGKKLKIGCEVVEDFYRISVFNTGKPIADDDIEHIWQSFYRADKAHSREKGRFGLGLAIVAEAQNLQNAKYGAVNHVDGVEFWFDVLIAENQK